MKQKKPFSQRYSERKLGRVHPKSIYAQADPECEAQVFAEYTEYLVDISANEYSVHWCGSTRQRLGLEYRRAEKELVEAAQDYYRDVYEVSDNVAVTKAVFESNAEFLLEKLKPTTLSRIIRDGVDFLGEIRQEKLSDISLGRQVEERSEGAEVALLREWRVRVPDLSKADLTVEYFNQERNITQETGEEYAMFFDLDKEVNLEVLEDMARDRSDFDSEPQMQYLESYVSNDSNDLELEEPPRLSLTRINSTM